MRPLNRLVLALLLILSLASPGVAAVATIETAVPLQDHSEQSIKVALTEVVQTIARGALAMGPSWVQVNRVLVLEETLTIQVLATDTDPRDQQQEHQGKDELEPAPGGERSTPALVLINSSLGR